MRVDALRALRGPNVYQHSPVLVVRLDLEALADVDSSAPGLAERLLAALPGLAAHPSASGQPGGFVEELRGGTSLAHVVEHVALELSQLAEIGVEFGQTTAEDAPGRYEVALGYRSEAGMREVVEAAVGLTRALLEGEDYPLAEAVARARRAVGRTELGPTTRAVVEAAERRGIPWHRADEGSLVRFGYGHRQRLVRASITDATSALAADLAGYTDLTKARLEEAFVPVPRGRLVRSEGGAEDALRALGGPVVVKPLNGNHGRGISVGVTTPEELREAFAAAREVSRSVLVEEQFTGQDYRVLVVGGRMVAASERCPCHVTGDGVRTVAALIEEENADPRRGEGHERPLTRIVLDDALRATLAKAGLTLDSVLPAGERAVLSQGANLSKGGTARDVTDEVHPEVRAVCERAARAVGLDVCGVDLVAESVARPLAARGEGVVEVNASPGLRMHLAPSEGEPRPVGEAILGLLYPEGAPARIPIVSVTGTNGKTTVTRLIGRVLQAAGHRVGMATTGGVWIGEDCIVRGDTTGPASARAVLTDPSVTAAVLETARGGIMRRGLGYDWADTAVITNVREDHLGQDGIRSLDDVIRVKALVAERVRDGGTLVVNADDPGALRLLERPGVVRRGTRVVYFAMARQNPTLARHLEAGGSAVYTDAGWIVEATGGEAARVVRLSEVPVAYGGLAAFQVANCLAAVAAARAHAVPLAELRQALAAFDPNADNTGRANLYGVGKGYVMVDYGHNADAFDALGQFLRQWAPGYPTIGIVNAPGDRSDTLLRETGRAAARAFSHLVFSEDKDLRGRAPGEVLRLLQEGAAAEAPDRPVEVVPDECEALRAVLSRVRDGAIALTFYEHLDPLLAVLTEAGAVPVDHVTSPLDRQAPRPYRPRRSRRTAAP